MTDLERLIGNPNLLAGLCGIGAAQMQARDMAQEAQYMNALSNMVGLTPRHSKLDAAKKYAAEVRKRKGWEVKRND